MTKAEKLVDRNPFEISLTSCRNDQNKFDHVYIAEIKPGDLNLLQIKDVLYPKSGCAIFLSLDSAAALAKFLKEYFLDE